MNCLRIYLTPFGIEGYYEGCSCCSATENVGRKEISSTLAALRKQISELEMLDELLEEHGETQVIAWSKQHEVIRELTARLEAAQKYKENKNIQGTFYKECFKSEKEDIATLAVERKNYKPPSLFKKYIAAIK